jgi:hypothetical protein
MAKEEALNELHLERQQRIEYEQKCIEFSRKAAELENRVLQQRFIQVDIDCFFLFLLLSQFILSVCTVRGVTELAA